MPGYSMQDLLAAGHAASTICTPPEPDADADLETEPDTRADALAWAPSRPEVTAAQEEDAA
jgi:hypothetical protein